MALLRIPLLGAAAVLLIASVVGLVRDNTPEAPAGEPGSVAIVGFEFAPLAATARVGEPVTWTNADSTPHTVTFTGAGPEDSGSIGQDGEFTVKPTEAGTFPYICSFHPFMTGTLEVTK